jgi:hypothetical protein
MPLRGKINNLESECLINIPSGTRGISWMLKQHYCGNSEKKDFLHGFLLPFG